MKVNFVKIIGISISLLIHTLNSPVSTKVKVHNSKYNTTNIAFRVKTATGVKSMKKDKIVKPGKTIKYDAIGNFIETVNFKVMDPRVTRELKSNKYYLHGSRDIGFLALGSVVILPLLSVAIHSKGNLTYRIVPGYIIEDDENKAIGTIIPVSNNTHEEMTVQLYCGDRKMGFYATFKKNRSSLFSSAEKVGPKSTTNMLILGTVFKIKMSGLPDLDVNLPKQWWSVSRIVIESKNKIIVYQVSVKKDIEVPHTFILNDLKHDWERTSPALKK